MLQRFFFFFSILFFFSCGKNYHFEQEHSISNKEWTYNDSLNFKFNISDTSKIYNLVLEINHTTIYPFQNMYAEIFTAFPEGQRIRELLSLELANRAGAWFGDCGSENCTLEIPIQEGAFFNQAGDYTITMKQFMRIDPLKGIQNLTLKIEDTGKTRNSK